LATPVDARSIRPLFFCRPFLFEILAEMEEWRTQLIVIQDVQNSCGKFWGAVLLQ